MQRMFNVYSMNLNMWMRRQLQYWVWRRIFQSFLHKLRQILQWLRSVRTSFFFIWGEIENLGSSRRFFSKLMRSLNIQIVIERILLYHKFFIQVRVISVIVWQFSCILISFWNGLQIVLALKKHRHPFVIQRGHIGTTRQNSPLSCRVLCQLQLC